MPHEPRSAAPQAPQGPDSIAAAEAPRGAPPTAKTDSSFSTFGLAQLLQTTAVEDVGTIFSNAVPQASHLNSKSGMEVSLVEI
jgi:hypothetical protein